MNLRPRDKDKELGAPSFRFQAKGGLERVYDTLINKNAGFMHPKEIMEQGKVKNIQKMNFSKG